VQNTLGEQKSRFGSQGDKNPIFQGNLAWRCASEAKRQCYFELALRIRRAMRIGPSVLRISPDLSKSFQIAP